MDLTPYLTRLREDLATTASATDESTQRAAAVLSAALEPAARLTLMNALADLAAEVTANLPDQVVEVRLDGRDVRVVVSGSGDDTTADPGPPPPPPPPPGPSADSGDISRITLRLVEQIKSQAEQAASAQGVSLNSWVAQAVQGALAGGHRRTGRRDDWKGDREGKRLRGWVEG